VSLAINTHVQAENILEEVIITAQKREESLQDAPIAISVLGEQRLESLGIDDLTDLMSGAIPALRVTPYPDNPQTLIINMRGVGTADPAQVTREAGVGIYQDGVYLGRSQGLGLDMVDLERIEVLKGPQGTLYGRNALGGAVNMISKKPSGEFHFKQVLGAGSFGYLKSLSQLELPETAGISSKLAFMRSKKDGWVDNDYSGAINFNEEDKKGARLALSWDGGDSVSVDYVYEQSSIEVGQQYYQFDKIPDLGGGFFFFDTALLEPERVEEARFGVPLEASEIEVGAQTLTFSVDISPDLTLKSITAYRDLEETLRTNYGGVFAAGVSSNSRLEQDQFSQELQLIGSTQQTQFILGAYWFEEQATAFDRSFGTVLFDPATGGNAVPVLVGQELFTLNAGRLVDVELQSWAVYGQLTWTPPVLQDRLDITLGARLSNDDKSGKRERDGGLLVNDQYQVDAERVDPMLSINYTWSENVSSYVRWATGYRAGGANMRSPTFRDYDEEELSSVEVGLKSELFDHRVRLNLASYATTYRDKQMDFLHPGSVSLVETINATQGDVKISGFEAELVALLGQGLQLSFDYAYTDWELQDQLNPLSNQLERFVIATAPRHSGAVSIDYTLPELSIGTVALHLDYNATDNYFYSPNNFNQGDARDVLNARITLSDVPLGSGQGTLKFALWSKNITDEQYIQYHINAVISEAVTYGEPRSSGIDVSFEY
jgi:iron complex outermembrane recepter protein